MIQVITNLISNAIKNTPPGGTIVISLKKINEKVRIIISDTGVGLTEAEKRVLFTRFGKIERKAEGLEYLNIKGSGLGLYISQKIIELHGGKIWAESEGRNKGAIFYIEFPQNLSK
jgi:signal transduction histidine kinase